MLNDGAALVFYNLFSQIYLSPLLEEDPIGWGEGVKLSSKHPWAGLPWVLHLQLVL